MFIELPISPRSSQTPSAIFSIDPP